MAGKANTPPGPATDATGQTVVDPTENVKALNTAASLRQDDLRKAAERLTDEKIKGVRRETKLRAQYERLLQEKEAERLNATRQVDVDATNTSATVQRSIADALAKTVVDTAAAQATSVRAEIDPIRKDIADLRQSQYEGVGAKLQTSESRVETQAKTSNTGMWIGIGIVAAGVLSSAFLGVAAIVVTLLLRGP